MLSPELETLDQLCGGAMTLAVVRLLYPDDATFRRSVYALLSCGDVRLVDERDATVPRWRWRELFVADGLAPIRPNLSLELTAQGPQRIS